jgi:opacity protein-like surface antigen
VLGPTQSFSVDDSFGVNGRVGYRCHPRFSVEEEVEWLHGFDGDISDPPGKTFTFNGDPWVFTTNTKGYLLTGRYQPFVLLGVGVMAADYDFVVRNEVRDRHGWGHSWRDRQIDFAMRFGAGIDLYATKHVVVSAEVDYVLPFGDLEDLDYLSFSLGLQYRF